MGEKGFWSWAWAMVFVIGGTLLIIVNHIVRNILRKKNNTFKAKKNDKKVGIISSLILFVAASGLIALAIYQMDNNPFEVFLAYNGFNVGLILLTIGISLLLGLGISVPMAIDGFKYKEAQHA